MGGFDNSALSSPADLKILPSPSILGLPMPAQTPIRIALICPSSSNGGLELTVHRLGRAIRKRGIDVMIAAPDGSPLFANAQRDEIRVDAFMPRRKYGDLRAVRTLTNALSDFGATHGVLFRSQDIHLAALAHHRMPTIRWTFYQQMQSAVMKRDFIHRWMHRHLSLWLTLTEQMRDDVIRCTTMPPDRVSVSFLGRDMSHFDPSRYSAVEARTALGLPIVGMVVGMIGRLDPQKGQTEFLRAARQVLDVFPQTMFIIAGEETRQMSGHAAMLHTLAHDLGVEHAVRFLPHMDDIAPMLAAMDIFVLPSHSETYGLVLIEAMAMRRAIVATDSGGVPELARHSQEALLVPPKDSASLAEAIIKLHRDALLRARLSAAAQSRARTFFDERACVDAFIAAVLQSTSR
jgi:glycosyltransferase involved in cell wall biosynthesis